MTEMHIVKNYTRKTHRYTSVSMIHVSVRLSDRSYTHEKSKKYLSKSPQWELNPEPLDHQANTLRTELTQHSVASLNLQGLYKVIILEMTSSSKCKVRAWNKTHFSNLCRNTYQASTVSKALECWSRGPGYNAHWGQYLVELILLFPTNFWQICQKILILKIRYYEKEITELHQIKYTKYPTLICHKISCDALIKNSWALKWIT